MKRLNLGLISAFMIVCFQAGFLSVHAAGVKWQSDIASAAAEAKSTNRFMLVEISAPWCPACRQLEKLMASSVIGEWTNSRFVSVHLSADAPDGKALLQKFGMDGIPALLVFGPDGKFKDKMSGGPEDEEGFKHFLTQMAGGEGAFANAGSAGGNSPFSAETDRGFNTGTADGAYPQPNYLPPSQQNSQQSPQQNYQQMQQSQPNYQQMQQSQPNYQQPQPVMQWQGQQPPASAQYPPQQRQFQQQTGQLQQQGQYPQQFQPAPQQYPPQGLQYPPQLSQPQAQQYLQLGQQYPSAVQQYPQAGQQYPPAVQQYPQAGQQYPPGQTYPPSGQQFPLPGQQYPQSNQQYQTQFAPPGAPIPQQQR